MRKPDHRSAEFRLAIVIALVAVVFAARLCFLRAWGSPLPFWDQWDAEASGLYAPWLRGTFDWSSLVASHNEHRIALTRLTDLALFSFFRRWDIWAELILNAFLHALTAGVILHLLIDTCTKPTRVIFALGIATLFVTIAGWQNALWGFQSQFYYSSLLAAVAIGGLIATVPLSTGWCLGCVAAILSLFSNAGGLLVSVAVLIVGTAAWLRTKESHRAWVGLLVLGAIAIAGVGLQVNPPHHAPLHAHSVGQFVSMLARCLAFPHLQSGWVCLAVQLPLLLLLILRRRQRQPLTRADLIAVALVVLGLLHGAAIAYSRGGGLALQGPLSRYQDAFLLGLAGQLYAAVSLAVAWNPGRLILIGWLGLIAVGFISLTEINLSLQLPRKRALDQIGWSALRSYQMGKDTASLSDPLVAQALHPSNISAVLTVLDDPLLASILPEQLRASPGSPAAAPPWIVGQSTALVITALLVFFATLGFDYRRRVVPGTNEQR